MGQLQSTTEPFYQSRELFRDLAALRQQDVIHYSTKLEAYVVTRYDDITVILDHPDVFSSKPTVPEPPSFVAEKIGSKCPLRGTLLGHDNPDHDRLRQSVNSFFVPRRLKRFELLIENLAHELLDKFAETGEVNLKAEFALPLPLKVISAVAGLNTTDWKWVAKSLSLFGGHHEFALETFDEKIEAIVEIHERIAQLIQQRRVDRRDDLISHIWDEREAGNVVMTDFEHLSMIPGLLLAGHETTTNLLSMGLSHLLHNGLWEAASVDDSTRKNALEELLRYESAITGMKRLVMRPFTIGSTTFKPGDSVFAAYNSGSRDEKYFPDGDQLDINRRASKQHLGFGRGIHACLGAPLARMLMQIELRVLHERLPGLRLVTPYNKVEYDPVHEGRGIRELYVSWDAEAAKTVSERRLKTTTVKKLLPARSKLHHTNVRVSDTSLITPDVLLVTLTAPTAQPLPSWTPGSHIDVAVGKYGWRQYSLCSDPSDVDRWQIAVLHETSGSGGSRYIHSRCSAGMDIVVGRPRNHFPLQPAACYLFIAGGIGITPIRAMYLAARAQGAAYRLVYLGSTRSRMGFAAEFAADPNAQLWVKDEHGPFDLGSLACNRINADRSGLQIYCCGPERLLQGVQQAFAHLPNGSVHVERFQNTAALGMANSENREFGVVLQRSGRRLRVAKEKSLLEVLNDNGTRVMSTCSKGTCGTCEVTVLEGSIEHRDTVLTADERLEGNSMMSCVSRCRDKELVLDLW